MLQRRLRACRSLVPVVVGVQLLLAHPLKADDLLAGRELFGRHCVACHGAMGEGSGEQKRALEGDLSVGELADRIQRTMPEDDPGSLTRDEARAVAAYVHDAFYSPVARERLRPPRIELSRMTSRQYRYSVADLVGSFRAPLGERGESGLRAEYFKGRRLGDEKSRVLQRIDSRIAFEFGRDAPVNEIEEPHEFSIRWEGTLWAPATGEYEFLVKTEHAARLWLNGGRQPLIDAWVKSGHDTEYRGTVFLLAGRPYPLKIEYTKAKQGVDDSSKQKQKPESQPSSITLLWHPPGQRGVEPVPGRVLSTGRQAESFACSAPFPPDDRSFGWERGNAVSKSWEQATTAAALETADYVVAHLDELAGTRDDAGDRRDKVQAFCHRFAERALRRPLTEMHRETLVQRPFGNEAGIEEAVRQVVVRVLKFPQFLYHEFRPRGDDWDVAARLGRALWDSLPDEPLREAAARGELSSGEQQAIHAERLLADPRGRNKLREFALVWLKADLPVEVAKDEALFPGFDESIVQDLKTSLELFWDSVVWSDSSDFRTLLTSEEVWLNHRLGPWYGAELPTGSEFQPVIRPDDQRAGVLTHPYLLARLSRSNESSPIHRGVFLARGLLGRLLKPPPEAVTPLPVEVRPELSTRERVTLQTSPVACTTCHALINPLGFTLERYDAIGRFRTMERGQPVDATGSYVSSSGEAVTLNGSRELGQYLVSSPEVAQTLAQQLFLHLVQQPPGAWGPQTLESLTDEFRESGYHLRQLVIRIALRTARLPDTVSP